MQIRWRHFLRTLHNHDIPFPQAMDGITAFIEPAWDVFVKDNEFEEQWDASLRLWG